MRSSISRSDYHFAKGGYGYGARRVWRGLALAAVLLGAAALGSWIDIETALVGRIPHPRAARVYLLIVPLSVLQGFGGAILLAEDRVGPFWGTRLVGALLYLVLLMALAALGSVTVFSTVIAILLSQVAATIAMGFWIKQIALPRPRWSGALCRQIITFGAKTNLVGMPYALNVRLDQVLMSIWLPASVLGLYATSFAWSSMLGMVAGGASTLCSPAQRNVARRCSGVQTCCAV